jgi:predicted phage tail protein
MTHVKLMGEMGEKFGAEWNMDVSNFRDVFRLIDCQTNGFKQYLTTCAEEGINFTIQNGEDLVDGTLDAMIAPVKDTVVITPVAAGAGMKDVLKVVFGVFLLMYGPGMADGLFGGAEAQAAKDLDAVTRATGMVEGVRVGSYGTTQAQVDAAAKVERIQKAKAFTTKAIQGVGTNLALSGVQGYLTPDTPSTSGKSYLFNGPENNVKEGVPVPLLYGQLMVGGSVINFGVEEEALPPFALQGYTRITDGSSSWTTSDGGSGGGSGKDRGITHAF